MSTKKTVKNGNSSAASGATSRDLEFEADVLFQRIFDKWYAFSMVEDDCLVSEVSEDEVNKRIGKKPPRAA